MGNIEPSCKRRPIAGLKSWWPPWGKKRYLLQNMACTTITKWDQSTRFLVRWRWTPRRAWITLPRIWIRWYILSVHNGFTLIVWMPYIIKPCESIQWVVYIYIYCNNTQHVDRGHEALSSMNLHKLWHLMITFSGPTWMSTHCLIMLWTFYYTK